MSSTTGRRSLVGIGAMVVAAGITLAGATTAVADTQDRSGEGWVRLAHLSPDTAEVDVELVGVDTADGFELEDVGYGDVSAYTRLPAGAYAVAMVPAGAPAGTDPLVSQVIEISEDQAYTAAAAGLNEDLAVRLITDDLTPPSEGGARVRLVQASVSSETVDVTTDTGVPIAEGVEFGTATDYAEVDSGRWTLEVEGDTQSGTVQVDLAPASVNTLFVIDRRGEISISMVEDSSGAQEMPTGGVATGGGGLYYAEQQRLRALVTIGLGALLLTVATLVVVRRRPTS